MLGALSPGSLSRRQQRDEVQCQGELPLPSGPFLGRSAGSPPLPEDGLGQRQDVSRCVLCLRGVLGGGGGSPWDIQSAVGDTHPLPWRSCQFDSGDRVLRSRTQSEGGRQTSAKKEQLIHLILKQIHQIVGGPAGSHEKWLPGELAAAVGGAGREGGGRVPGAPSPAPPGGGLSSPEAEPRNWSGRTSATSATTGNNPKTPSKRFPCSGYGAYVNSFLFFFFFFFWLFLQLYPAIIDKWNGSFHLHK